MITHRKITRSTITGSSHGLRRVSPLLISLALLQGNWARAQTPAEPAKVDSKVREVYARPVKAFGKQWMLRLTEDLTYIDTFRTEKSVLVIPSRLLLLQRTLIVDGQEQPASLQKVWRDVEGLLKLGEEGEEEGFRVYADVHVDEAAKRIYQVRAVRGIPALGPWFVVDIIGWDDIAVEPAPDTKMRAATPEEIKTWADAHVLAPRSRILGDNRNIEAAQIEKQGDELIVTLPQSDKSEPRFAVSLKTREWRRLYGPNDPKPPENPEPKPLQPEPDDLQAQEEEVLQKTVGRDRLIVTRRRATAWPPEPKQAGQEPNQAGTPAYYLYSARLRRENEPPRLVWRKRVRDPKVESPLEIFGVQVGKSSLAVLFRKSFFVQAEVVRLGEPLDESAMILGNIIADDSYAQGWNITEATLEGSPDDGTLRAKITRANGRVDTYAWQKHDEATFWKQLATEEAKLPQALRPRPDEAPAK